MSKLKLSQWDVRLQQVTPEKLKFVHLCRKKDSKCKNCRSSKLMDNFNC